MPAREFTLGTLYFLKGLYDRTKNRTSRILHSVPLPSAHAEGFFGDL